MSAGAIEGNQGPDFDDVLQLEDTAPAVPVRIDETVSIQPAQSLGGTLNSVPVLAADTAPRKLLNTDATRGMTTIIGGAAFFLGYDRAEAAAKTIPVPGSVAIAIRNGEAVWVSANADTYVTAICDKWTR